MKTRQRVRRVYKWRGKPLMFDRKLKNFEYGSLVITVDGLPRPHIINTGHCILIEGEDEDNPYVAKVTKLFGDESGHQKKAIVQWFVRVSEVPISKLQQLGREPHPQEIFYYQGQGCNEEVNAESILRSVQVKHLNGPAPFPDHANDKDTLYVKLSWDTKAFKIVDSALFSSSTLPSWTKSSSCSSHTASLTNLQNTEGVMNTLNDDCLEVESLHSATRLSASNFLSTKISNASARGPRVCKRLEPHSTGKNSMPFSKMELTERVSTSHPQVLHRTDSLTELQKMHRTPDNLDICLKPLIVMMNKLPVSGRETPQIRAVSSMSDMGNENSPMLLPATIPRSSKRKSAQLVSDRIKTQLNLLNDPQNLNSDSEDEDEFFPSKKALSCSSGYDELVSEDESILIRTLRQDITPSRVPHSKKTPATVMIPCKTPGKKAPTVTSHTSNHAVPTIPSRLMPVRHPTEILEVARTRLHVSAVPESLPCREQEFQDIYSFVESRIMDGTGGCMYISGVPGTGKTATVQEVTRCLENAANINEIPSFHLIEINGMKMTDPHQAYVQILEKLTGQKATADHAASLLEKQFSSPAPRTQTIVLLVDELDLLWTRKQNVMYNLFDWPTRRHSRLVVIAIANTMDLPERIMINRVASRLGLTRMSFQPYGFKELQQIIMSRLNKVKAFEEDALQLVSRKVAALSGDARRCLDICRRAAELCEQSTADNDTMRLVRINHVMDALNETFSSSYITGIKSASAQEKLFLRAVITEFRRLGLEEATLQQVFMQLQALCRVDGLQPITVSEALAICHRLGACRLLLLETSRLGILQHVRLNVSQDDIFYALKSD
ncbi:origin recognition complex subunit 1 isoform X2 [Stigmatopora argus]